VYRFFVRRTPRSQRAHMVSLLTTNHAGCTIAPRLFYARHTRTEGVCEMQNRAVTMLWAQLRETRAQQTREQHRREHQAAVAIQSRWRAHHARKKHGPGAPPRYCLERSIVRTFVLLEGCAACSTHSHAQIQITPSFIHSLTQLNPPSSSSHTHQHATTTTTTTPPPPHIDRAARSPHAKHECTGAPPSRRSRG
jgi:hypothetical protein